MLATVLATLLLATCADVSENDAAVEDASAEQGDEKADGAALPLRFLPGELSVPMSAIHVEVRKVFRTEAELESTLGIENPGIDFAREWAVFYTPGTSRQDLLPGYRARVDRVAVSSTALTLKVTTSLEQNGNCPRRTARPFVLAAIPIPDPPPQSTRFSRADRIRNCPVDVVYHDGVSFTSDQAAGALRAANEASPTVLNSAGITGTQAEISVGGRPWGSLATLAGTANIGPATMEKLRTLGASF